MRGRWATLIVAFAVLGAAGLGFTARAQDSSSPSKKARKPAQVNVVQSVPLDVATLPPVSVASLPRRTHIGQSVDSLVVLNLVNPTTAPIFVRGHDDGTSDTTEFAVPAGSKLVVTDADWVVTADNAVQFATLRLFVENTTTTTNRSLVFLQTGPTTNHFDSAAGSAPGFGTTGLHAGFVVGPNARVVADVRAPSAAASSGTTLAPFTYTNASVVLRGYLIATP